MHSGPGKIIESKSIEANSFIAHIDKKNKWAIIFTDKTNGRIINLISIPPTKGNRVDIITYDKIIPGYSMGIDAIIVIIENGEPFLMLTKK